MCGDIIGDLVAPGVDIIKDVTGVSGAEESAKQGAASVERASERQVEFERERLAEESRRWEIGRLEEGSRYEALTSTEQQRYTELKALEQQRYEAMTGLEKERYDDRQSYYESLTAEEKTRYEATVTQEQQRYEAELARIEGMTEEEKVRYADQISRVEDLTAEERQRYDAYSTEEKLRYARGVGFSESITTEEKRRYDLLSQEEKSRWQQLTGEEQRRYESQVLQQKGQLESAQEALKPFVSSEQAARDQLSVELGLAPGEAGTAYMETPGYKMALEERQRQVEQEMATMGSAYSGRRVEEAAKAGSDVQSQYYQNYMGMLSAMASPETAKTLASLGISQPLVSGDLGGPGQLYAGQPSAGGLPGTGAPTMGQPGAGQPTVSGTPYLGGPGGTPVYATPGAGTAPTGSLVGGQLPGTGQLYGGQVPGVGSVPLVGGGLTSAAQQAADIRMSGASIAPAFMGDLIGGAAQIYGGTL